MPGGADMNTREGVSMLAMDVCSLNQAILTWLILASDMIPTIVATQIRDVFSTSFCAADEIKIREENKDRFQ